VRVVLECAAGHTHLPPEAVYRVPGPGARFLDPAKSRALAFRDLSGGALAQGRSADL
jgi:hypothetical protein